MIQRIRLGMVNSYLLRGSGGDILIDTGTSGQAENILCALPEDASIRLILLTHGHSDHTGSAAELSERLQAPIAMTRTDYEAMQSGKPICFEADNPLGRILSHRANGQTNPPDFVPAVFLEEDMPLAPYGAAAQVVLLPGHTEGSAGVLTADGAWIVGDAMMHMLCPTKARMYEHAAEAKSSAARILASRSELICPGHGKPFCASACKL